MLSVITKILASVIALVCIVIGEKLKQRGIDTGNSASEVWGYSLQIATAIVGAAYKWYLERKQPPKDASQSYVYKGQQLIALLCLLPLLSILAGCKYMQPPQQGYVTGDRATFEAVSPEYRSYVSNDANLSISEQQRRYRTLETWRLRIESAERAIAATQPSQ